MRKSYWQSASLATDYDRNACKSWFGALAAGMTPYRAEILCDVETDSEKKIRAFMTDRYGKHWEFTRTKGHRFSISRKPLGRV